MCPALGQGLWESKRILQDPLIASSLGFYYPYLRQAAVVLWHSLSSLCIDINFNMVMSRDLEFQLLWTSQRPGPGKVGSQGSIFSYCPDQSWHLHSLSFSEYLSLAGVLQSVGIYISCWSTEMLLLQMTWLSRRISSAVFSVSGTHGLLCPLSYANSPLCAWHYLGFPRASRVSHCCPLTLCILESSLEHQASAIGAQLIADNFYTCISPTACVHSVCPLSVYLAKTSWLRPNPVSITLENSVWPTCA